MKKKILALVLCGVMILGITGCGNSENENKKTEDNTKTEQTTKINKDVSNGMISCISPYGNETKTETEDTTIENSIATKHIITEVNNYSNDDEYKKECDYAKTMENPLWEGYQNDKVTCDDSTKMITHIKTYIKDENLSEVYNIKKYTKDNGTFDSKGYIEELEEYKYVCTIK